jgi:VWFA-related protein
VGFTSDRAQLKGAIAGLGMAAPDRLRDPLGIAWDLNIKVQETTSFLSFETEDERDSVYQLLRSEQEAYRRRVGAYVAGLDALASMLNAVQGRKQVVLFSAGFDQSVLSGSQGAERQEASRAVTEGRLWEVQSDSYFGDATARGGLDQLFRRLGASDAVLHTVDIGGLAAAADVSDATRTQIGRGRDSLAQLASGSGGLFLKEVNDVGAALRDVMDASRYFYVLGFAPPEDGKAGRFRKLSVKVRRGGAKVSHRVGYVVADPKAATGANAARMTAADAIAKGLSGGSFALEALAIPVASRTEGPADPAAGEPGLLPVALQVDGAGLLSGVTEDKLALEVYGYVLDADGRILDALSATPSLDLVKVRQSLLDSGLQVLTVFKAPGGTADLRFLVRHPASGRASSLRLLAPAEAKTAWPVSSPIVMSDPSTRLVMPVPSRGNPELDLPFRVGQRAFSPEVDPVLKNGVASEVCVMTRPPRGPSLEVMADLRGADGKTTSLETSGPVRLSKDRDGAFRIVLNLTPNGIPAGDYALRVTLRDEAGQEVFAEQPVGVK